MVKTSVTIQGQNYDLYPLGYDLTRVGKLISFTDNTYQVAIFAEALVNFNPAEPDKGYCHISPAPRER